MDDVRKERSGWRDELISARHRMWGWDVPCVDLDFLLIEYDNHIPRALIEYKNERATTFLLDKLPSGIEAIKRLGNTASIPVFVCRYASDFSWMKVGAINKMAVDFLTVRVKLMSEYEYVKFLYSIRGRKMPESVRDKFDCSETMKSMEQ